MMTSTLTIVYSPPKISHQQLTVNLFAIIDRYLIVALSDKLVIKLKTNEL